MPTRAKPPKSTATLATRPSPSARNSRVNTRGRPFGPDHPGRPFQPGNPGRPKGARNKASLMLERMFHGEAEEIGRKAIELAKDGTLGAVKLVIDRAYPVPRSRSVE